MGRPSVADDPSVCVAGASLNGAWRVGAGGPAKAAQGAAASGPGPSKAQDHALQTRNAVRKGPAYARGAMGSPRGTCVTRLACVAEDDDHGHPVPGR